MDEEKPLWPNPPGFPLYCTVQQAADIAGVSYGMMKAMVDDAFDPIPHICVGGKKKLIRTSALPEYLRKKEVNGCSA